MNTRDEAFRQQVLTGNLWWVVLRVCIPLSMYQGLQQAFKMLDTMMASHIGSEAVSAVAYLSQISVMLSAIGGGLAIGGSIKISEAYGRGDYELVRKRVSTLIGVCTGMGLLLLAIILPLTDPFLRMVNTPPALIEIGRIYFIVDMISMVSAFLNNAYIAVERVRGNTVRILWLNIAFAVSKLALTAWFVYGLGSSTGGIAAASLIAQLLMSTAAVFFLRDKTSAFGFSWRAISLRGVILKDMVQISFPVMVERISFSLGKVIVNAMSSGYGALTVGALGVSNSISGISNSLQTGFQEGGVGIISQNRAAGNPKRVIKAFGIMLSINLAIGVAGLVLTHLFLRQITFLFSNSAQGLDAQFQQMIMDIYFYDSIGGCIPLGVTTAAIALLLGLGYTKLTLYLNFSRIFLFRVPVLWFLQNFTQLGSISVGVVMMISNVASGVLCLWAAWWVIRRLKTERV